jgi:HNH endonuclease
MQGVRQGVERKSGGVGRGCAMMSKKKKHWSDILVMTRKKPSQATARKYYTQWRLEHWLPPRCDNPKCQFHAGKLEWLGEKLPLIMDHLNGNRCDNSPGNLRLLCPNCDSQLPTRGGANRGRVVDTQDGGYILRNKDGSKIVASTGTSEGSSSATGVGETKQSELKDEQI